jgi:hypothetical protein
MRRFVLRMQIDVCAYIRRGYSGLVGLPGRRTLLLILTFIAAVALTFVFAYRAGRAAHSIRWGKEPIHGWMNIRFIAHAHHVPAEVLYHAIGVEPRPDDRRPLRRLAREQKRPVEQLIQKLNAAIEQKQPSPPGTPRP